MERGESRTRRGEGRYLREGGIKNAGDGDRGRTSGSEGGSGRADGRPTRGTAAGRAAAADDPGAAARAAAKAARAARLAKARAARDAASPRPARSTRPGPQRGPRSEQGAAAVRRPGPAPAPQPVRRFPDSRLTGLGSGLFCAAVMLVLGCLDSLLFGSLTLYSVLFLPVCVLTAVWVREGDLPTAPVAVPIAFAVGLLPLGEGGGGFSGHLMGLVSALATEAGWLYGGTLIAGLVVLVRRVRLVARRVAARRRAGASGGQVY
ncbi:DUF6542 domain-containing protein [Streptomyces sp. bgisy027]|uniref:DUF6542 domain-containing protein n=1 Tax=unclassified Streptomyces TaxID=2593676 RepID=UPI003D754A51